MWYCLPPSLLCPLTQRGRGLSSSCSSVMWWLHQQGPGFFSLVHFALCQLSKRMGGVHRFCNLVLWFYKERGWCIISKAERERRKQEEDIQCLCIRVDVQSNEEWAGKLLCSPALPVLTVWAVRELCFHTHLNFAPWWQLFPYLLKAGHFFPKVINWIWFRSTQNTIPLSSKSTRKIISFFFF